MASIQEWNNKLLSAVITGRINLVQECLQNEADINCLDKDGNTPIGVGVIYDHYSVTKYLLDHGADINKCGKRGRPPLFLAVYYNRTSFIEMLLKYNASVNIVDEDGDPALIYAVKSGTRESVKLLLNSGADINCLNSDGYTALAISAENIHCLDNFKFLLEENADVCKFGKINGKPPLTTAASSGNLQAVQLLICSKKVQLDAINSDGNTALTNAVKNEQVEVVKYLVEMRADICKCGPNGTTPLSMAIQIKNLDLINYLLDHGAASTLPTAFLTSIEKNDLDIVRLLEERGAKTHINLKYTNGYTPLSKAIDLGYLNIAEHLVENGANFEGISKKLKISYLLKHIEKQDLKMVEFLTNMGVDLNWIGSCGYTPLTKSVEIENFALVEHFVMNAANVNEVDGNCKTALGIAASNASFSIVKYLIERGAHIRLAKTELDGFAKWNEDFRVYFQKLEEEAAKLLTGNEEVDEK